MVILPAIAEDRVLSVSELEESEVSSFVYGLLESWEGVLLLEALRLDDAADGNGQLLWGQLLWSPTPETCLFTGDRESGDPLLERRFLPRAELFDSVLRNEGTRSSKSVTPGDNVPPGVITILPCSSGPSWGRRSSWNGDFSGEGGVRMLCVGVCDV